MDAQANNDPERAELREQYRLALEEYRFQVDLNWRRSEYFFVLNVGVLIAGVSLLAASDVPDALVAMVFGIGALLATLSLLANATQHGYYRSARDLKAKLEDELGLGGRALATTPTMGSAIQRLGRVGTFLSVMLVGLAVVDVVGATISVSNALDREEATVRVAIHPVLPAHAGGDHAALVVSHGDGVVISRTVRLGRLESPLALAPGNYEVALLRRGTICKHPISVGRSALQVVKLRCH